MPLWGNISVLQFYDGKDIITSEHCIVLSVYCGAGLSVTFYIWETGLCCSYCSHRHGQRIDFFLSSGYFFFLICTSLKLLSAWQETPALQKFRPNSRTNKVLYTYPFLRNRQENRLKVLTVWCLFLFSFCSNVPSCATHRCSQLKLLCC